MFNKIKLYQVIKIMGSRIPLSFIDKNVTFLIYFKINNLNAYIKH